jgi:hypothetical protein
LAVLTVGGMPGCGTSSNGHASATTSPSGSSTTAPPASTSTAPSTSTTVALAPLSSPDAAANALINAWRGGDRAGALRVALPAAVDAMFGHPVQPTNDRGCQDPIGGSSTCAFMYGSGLLTLQTTTVSGGWVVQSATFE